MRSPAPAELHEASYANPADVIRQLRAAMESMQATLRPRCTDEERRDAFVALERWFLVTETQVLERVNGNVKSKKAKRASHVLHTKSRPDRSQKTGMRANGRM